MNAFGFHRPGNVNDALALLGEDRCALAGGTDLVTLLKADIRHPESLVDLKRAELPEGIRESDSGISIGALTTIRDIERSRQLREDYTLLVEAAQVTATHQLRNRATIGGNLLQEPRCWYFRHPDVHCWLKGGETCPARQGRNEFHAVLGGGTCAAVHPSDLAGCLVALDAKVRLASASGERCVSLYDFFTLPTAGHRRLNSLAADELLLSIEIPQPAKGSRTAYIKAMNRKAWAFALVGVAMSLAVHNNRVTSARAVLNGVAPVPWLLSSKASPESPLAATELTAELIGLFNAKASALPRNEYKLPLARVLLGDAIGKLLA